MTNALNCWDATMSAEHIAREELQVFLKKHCKHWAFQLEKGADTGYEHYQIRMSLGVKRRFSDLNKLVGDEGWVNYHLSPTVTANKLPNDAFYVLKPETRIEGPWTSEDEQPAYIPRQIRDITLRAWQAQIAADAHCWDTRHINVVVEKWGNKGKSILATWLGVKKLGRSIPPVNDYKDIMRIVYDMPPSPLYIVDMPRGIEQKKLHNFYAGLEEVKSGHCWDDRYSYKEKYFDCPNIWVFTNTLPDMTYLSADRWIIWVINDDETLGHLNKDRDRS